VYPCKLASRERRSEEYCVGEKRRRKKRAEILRKRKHDEKKRKKGSRGATDESTQRTYVDLYNTQERKRKKK
jgi:hypothetical protein